VHAAAATASLLQPLKHLCGFNGRIWRALVLAVVKSSISAACIIPLIIFVLFFF